MGRNKLPLEDGRSAETIAADRHVERQLEREEELAVIDATYAEGEYNRDRVIGEISYLGQQIGRAFVEVGRRLLLLKEHEEHGKFVKCLERLEIPRTSAYRFMKCALVAGKCSNLEHLPQAKLLELATLDDEELAELDEGGTVANLSLDDVAKASVSELRDKLRAAESEKKALAQRLEGIIENKNGKLTELEKMLVAKPEATEEEQARERLRGHKNRVVKAGFEARRALQDMEQALSDSQYSRGATVDLLLGLSSAVKKEVVEIIDAAMSELTDKLDELRPQGPGL